MKQEKFLMRVDNNKEGRNLIHSMKRNLNSDSYRIVIRNSGPRPAGTSQISTSRENAKSLRVYVESKLSVDYGLYSNHYNWEAKKWERTPETIDSISETRNDKERLEQELAEQKNAVLHEQVKIEKLEAGKKLLEAKLLLLTERIQDSSKYGNFVKTVNSVEAVWR